MPGRLAALAVVVVLAAASGGSVSLALFGASGSTTARLATGNVQPPTAVAAGVAGNTVTLTWTPTVTAGADGYSLLRSATSGSGYAAIANPSPASISTATDEPGNGAWYYVLRTVLANWTSALSDEASATLGGTTGFVDCSANAPETTGSGHNDGYETNPAGGCAVDGSLALDSSSGTDASLSCTDAGKDRHRYWGFAFGLPATVTSIDGIEINLDAGLNNQGRTAILCVQLSWNGGTTWTSPQQATLVGAAVATYAFGGATDTWGRAWTLAQLDPSAFRVRITDVTDHPNKEFRLDGVTVQVDYTP